MFERFKLWRQRRRARDLRPIDLKYMLMFHDYGLLIAKAVGVLLALPFGAYGFGTAYIVFAVLIGALPGLMIDCVRWMLSPWETYEPSKNPMYDARILERSGSAFRRWWPSFEIGIGSYALIAATTIAPAAAFFAVRGIMGTARPR